MPGSTTMCSRGTPESNASSDGATKPGGDVVEQVPVRDVVSAGGVALHLGGSPKRMHETDRHPSSGGENRELGPRAQAGDVIDERRAGIDGGTSDCGLRGVDGQRHADVAQADDDGEHAGELVGDADGNGSGAGRLAADVEQIGTGANELKAMFNRMLRIGEQPAVRKRVRGDIDDAHDQRALTQGKPADRSRRSVEPPPPRGADLAVDSIAVASKPDSRQHAGRRIFLRSGLRDDGAGMGSKRDGEKLAGHLGGNPLALETGEK